MVSRALAIALVLAPAACSPRSGPHGPTPAELSSPGPLAASHEAFACNDCHVDGTRVIASAKCLGCHEHRDLRARVDKGTGFHATAQVRGSSCARCHLDHKGAAYDLRGWRAMKGGEAGFDHDLTGWPLHGPHAATACAACHPTQDQQGLRTYLAADRACRACHEQDQPHRLSRPELTCDRCHRDDTWAPVKPKLAFDHGADTAMRLTGAHAAAPCAACHAGGVFDLPAPEPTACAGCHPNSHAGHLFAARACEDCHSPRLAAPEAVAFVHASFDLGAHRKHACVGCHTQALGTTPPKPACATCHANESPHGTRFKAFGSPPACEVCHRSGSWRSRAFDHGARTRFQVTSWHADLTCRACHRGDRPDEFERFKRGLRCMGCHAHARVHADDDHPTGRFTNDQCLTCHRQGLPHRTPEVLRAIHGPGAPFPLVKRHKSVPCADCHTAGAPGSDALSPACSGCHADAHRGANGTDCARCHTPGIWTVAPAP